jgi:hypothetical protein
MAHSTHLPRLFAAKHRAYIQAGQVSMVVTVKVGDEDLQ